MMIHFFVPGNALPAGSKSAFPIIRKSGKLGVAVADANPRSKEWRAVVALFAREAYREEPVPGPVEVRFVFIRSRPKSHYNCNGKLKKNAPPFPITRPDVLKQARAVEDALTGILWADDAQIVVESLSKQFGAVPGVDIVMRLVVADE